MIESPRSSKFNSSLSSKIINELKGNMICHTSVERGLFLMDRCFDGAQYGGDNRSLIIIGDSGTGKSRLLEYFENRHKRFRVPEGLIVPVLRAKIHSKPTVKGLAEDLLHSIEDPLFDKGTENAKTIRLKRHIKSAKTKMLLLDEFQHFVDRSSNKIQNHVADWLKILVDETDIGLIVAGLPYSTQVIEFNSQLKRRFQAPHIMPRFDWRIDGHRTEFRQILMAMQNQIDAISFPDLSSNEMAFRVYCATGGIIGRISNLLVEAISIASHKPKAEITLEDLAAALKYSCYDHPDNIPPPFGHSFSLPVNNESIEYIMSLGATDMPLNLSHQLIHKPRRASHVLST